VSALDVSVAGGDRQPDWSRSSRSGRHTPLISHDLLSGAILADHVAVMYLGKVMEFGKVTDVFAATPIILTERLMSAVPIADPDVNATAIILRVPSQPTDRPRAALRHALPPQGRRHLPDDQTRRSTARERSPHRCHIPLDELKSVERISF